MFDGTASGTNSGSTSLELAKRKDAIDVRYKIQHRIVTKLKGKLEQFCTILVKNRGVDLTYFLFNVCNYIWHAAVQWKFFNKACLNLELLMNIELKLTLNLRCS